MASKTKSVLSLILKLAVAVTLITYLVKSGHLDPKDLWELMTPANVAFALILLGLNNLVAAWRWVILLQARGFPVTLSYGYSLFLIGVFFNHALPGSVGGDVVKGYYLVRDYPDRRLDAILSIVIDRVLGLYSFFILTLIAVVWDFDFVSTHEQIRWVALMCFSIFMGMTVFFTVAFSERLSKLFGLHLFEKRVAAIHKVVTGLQRFGKNRVTIALSVFVSLLSQVLTIAFFYQAGIIMGEPGVTWKAVLFVVPMGFLVTAIPIAPAGIGVGQVAFAYLFQAYLERSTQFGANSVTAFQLTLICWALVGAVFYLKRRKPHDLEEFAQASESASI